MTGEAWNEIMHALGMPEKFFRGIAGIHCVDELVIDTELVKKLERAEELGLADEAHDLVNQCGTPLAQVYFLTFTMLVTFICLNLVIAVVLEGFEDASNSDQQENIQICLNHWKRHDPEYRMEISAKGAITYIMQILTEQEDLKEAEKRRVNQFLEKSRKADPAKEPKFSDLPMKIATFCKLPVASDHRVHFIHVAKAALRLMTAYADPERLPERMMEIEKADSGFMERMKTKHSKHLDAGTNMDADMEVNPLEAHVAAAKIQALFEVRRERIAAQAELDAHKPPTNPPPVEAQRAG
jgi:hypothetical protein